jgi:hypothetical protein
MSSLNALKYKITITSSYYAGIVIFLLYSIVILLTLFVTSFSLISLLLYLLLFATALYAARKTFLQQDELLFSESGLVERMLAGTRYHGKISSGSFYNRLFIFLKIDVKSTVISGKNKPQFITIYKDAVDEEQFRLLARLINSGRG